MPFMKNGKRDYKAEANWEKTKQPSRVKDRAKRNAARATMIKAGKAKVGDGTHVDHKKELTKGGSNSKSNLRVVKASTNLRKEAKRKAKK